jgi:hypothetical protein
MHAILFALGLVLSSAGLAVVAYGFREIEFTIGTTLILAGTVAGTGGLLLIGLAAVVHKLSRLAGMPASQPLREAEPAEPQLSESAARHPTAAPARIPFPPRPQVADARDPRVPIPRAPEPRVPEPRVAEPTLDAASDPIFGDMLGQAASEFPPEPRIEPRAPVGAPLGAPVGAAQPASQVASQVPAPQVAAPSRPAEPPMVDDHDEVPLSPRPPVKVPLRHQPAPPFARARAEPRTTNGSAASSSVEEPRADAAEQPPVNFESLWPAEKRASRPPRDAARAAPAASATSFVERRGEAAARREEVRPEPPRRSNEAQRLEPSRQPSRAEPPVLRVEPAPLRTESVARVEAPPVRHEPYVPGTEPPALRIESEPPPAAATPSEPPRAVAILKSGVVDGMAYTLYADGSIEAQLPAGTLRFGSIAELREHIEQNS